MHLNTARAYGSMIREKLAAIVIVGVIGVFVAVGSFYNAQSRPPKAYRIGWEEDPPFQTKGAGGSPTGFGVDLVGEAARRRGIRLQWVFSPKSSERSLREGDVELWPLMTITAERKKHLHFSEPYLQHDHYFMIRADSPFSQPHDLSSATITYLDLPLGGQLLRRIVPNAHVMATSTTKEAIDQVCAHRADAAFTDEFTALSSLFNGLSCANQPLRTLWIPPLRTQLGVGSVFAASGIADEIRQEIGALDADGTLMRLMARWGYYLPRNLQTTTALLNAGKAERRLSYTIAFFVALSLLALAVANHIRRQRNRIKQEVMERERAESTLRESERRFRDLLEHAQLLTIMIDLERRISFCNNHALAITGWSSDEMIGSPAERFLDADYLRQLERAVEMSPAASIPLPFSESTILTKHGQHRWIQWTSTVLRDSSGRAIGLASLGEDVTELRRLRAEAAIRESEERFRAIFQGAAIGVAQMDLEGHITLANDQYCAILGTTQEALAGKSFCAITHPDDIGREFEDMNRLLSGEVPSYSMEKRYIREDGTVLWGRLHASLIRDYEGRPQHFIKVLEDITERNNAEAALRESEERFRNMADTAPVMIWVSGPNNECTFVSKGWLAFTGRTLEQELGDGWMDSLHPEDRERCAGTVLRASQERAAYQMEYRMRSADGSYRWIKDEGVPRFGKDGVFEGYIGSCTDVTNIKLAHEEALARQKLESLGVLAGGIAHDFNNLLGSIMADSELVLSELAPGSVAREGIDRINAVALRAAEIVRELLAYAGKESALFEPVDAPGLVREMIQLLKVSVSKRAALHIQLPEGLPAVRANAAQIRQVVLNLVTNASEALGEEGGVISITARRIVLSHDGPGESSQRLSAGPYLRLEVTDNGCGMSDEVQAKMFDPFFTTKFAGRGLGLAAVQGIVRAHGGAIRVKSASGKGTRFQVLLPLLHETAPKEDGRHESPENSVAGNEGTVLLVEDEESLRVPVSKMLRKKGYTVIETSNGDTAVELFRIYQHAIDIVLLDMTLPGMSGPEIFCKLQGIQPEVKVVFTTAYSHETLLSALDGQQPFGFIRKPYHLRDLLSVLRDARTVGIGHAAGG